MPKQISTEDFIARANNIHNNFYDYSQVLYTKMHAKVKIIDPEYGEFWQSPMGHLQGQGHPGRRYIKMAAKRRKPLELFIQQSRNKHGDLYDYSKVVYTTVDTKVCIIDPDYGEFWQSPYQHLNSHGCPARTAEKQWVMHIDHIIPLSIVCSSRKKYNDWNKDRPLYKFLNTDANLHEVTAKFNNDKNDYVTINNKQITASSIRNNYEAIGYLIKTQLNTDPTDILEQDKQHVQKYLGLIG
jgi:hypothetical protein